MRQTKPYMTAFLLLHFLVIRGVASGNPPVGQVHGRVTDKRTGSPLPGVNVFLNHTTVGAATDDEGRFHINKPPIGSYTLVASMMGYKTGYREVKIEADREVAVDFLMEESLVEMGAVVVTGTATPHLYAKAPVRTEVVPRQVIALKHAANLAEALNFQNGVRVEGNCQNCNFTQVRIHGLEGKYTEILVDGDPVMSTLAGVYGLEQFPEEMIAQVEIVKGGGSALYGGGAVGGVVNLITSRPVKNETQLKYFHNFMGAPEHRVSMISEISGKSGKSGAYLFGSARTRRPHDHNGDGFSELGELKHESLGMKWFYQPIQDAELTGQLHRIHETRRGGNMFDLPVHEAQVAEAAETWRWGGSIKWEQQFGAPFDYHAFYSFAHTERQSFYGGLGDQPGWNSNANRLANLAAYGRTENPLHIAGAQVNYRFGAHLFTGGMQYKADQLNDRSVSNPFYDIDKTFSNVAVFLQDNLHFLDKDALEFVIGARADKHSELNHVVFSPRLTSKWAVSDAFSLRASVTTGFKAPQVFDEDLHIMAIDGKQRVIRNMTGLKEESSLSMAAGFEVQTGNGIVPILFSFSGFYTNLDDAFALETDTQDENAEFITLTRINTHGATVKGVEFNLAVRMAAGLEMRSGFTFKRSAYDSYYEVVQGVMTNAFMRTPDMYGNLLLSYDVSPSLTLTCGLNYTGAASVPNEEPAEKAPFVKTSDQFVELDAGLSFQMPVMTGLSPKLSFGMKNILNAFQDDLERGAARNPAYVYGPERPRRVFTEISFSF